MNECYQHFSDESLRLLSADKNLNTFLPFRFPGGYHYDFSPQWYPTFCDIRENLIDIADYFKQLRNTDFPSAESNEHLPKWLPDLDARLRIIDKSRLEVKLGGFAQIIDGIDGDRIRICEICTQLFWAKRVESKACSATCANNLRQRLYRTLSREEKTRRKDQRESNRRHKKRIEETRRLNELRGTKSHGNL